MSILSRCFCACLTLYPRLQPLSDPRFHSPDFAPQGGGYFANGYPLVRWVGWFNFDPQRLVASNIEFAATHVEFEDVVL